jgi:hypothetical protein
MHITPFPITTDVDITVFLSQLFERARQLLTEADSVVADLSYVLSKHVRWQVLLADLLQHFMNEASSSESAIQDLVKKTKTCLTSIRLGQGRVTLTN